MVDLVTKAIKKWPFLSCVGHALQWDEIVMEGDPLKYQFVAYYVKDNKVLAVCSMNADPAVSTAAELMYQKKMPSGEEVK